MNDDDVNPLAADLGRDGRGKHGHERLGACVHGAQWVRDKSWGQGGRHG